jgi:outer membrane lipoprotein-sorting protein
MRRLMFIAMTAVLFSWPLSAQTVDEIIAKHIAAQGGAAKLKAIQSLRLTGNAEFGGVSAGFTQVFKRPTKMRLDITIQGLTLTQAYDGQNGWQIVPFTGKKDPEPMSADDAKNAQEQADFDGPLVDYKQKGNIVELIGKEKIWGSDAYHLKVTLKNGNVRDLFMDAGTFFATRQLAKTMARGAEVEFETAFGDYKAVEGVMFPFSIVQHQVGGKGAEQKITFSKVEINPAVEESVFKMPAVAPAPAPEKAAPATAPK